MVVAVKKNSKGVEEEEEEQLVHLNLITCVCVQASHTAEGTIFKLTPIQNC